MSAQSMTANKFHSGPASDLDQLLSGIALGDPDALARLYRQTSASIYAFAFSMLKNAQDAEDVLHDCYLSIHAGAVNYRSAGKPMAWIITIARNLCLQKLREYKKSADIPPEDWELYLESREGISMEDRLLLSACMGRLSDEERQIIALHAVAGFRHREIADMLTLPLATVLTKYSRAIKKLRKHLSGEVGNDDKQRNRK